jgi:hypothetical protein
VLDCQRSSGGPPGRSGFSGFSAWPIAICQWRQWPNAFVQVLGNMPHNSMSRRKCETKLPVFSMGYKMASGWFETRFEAPDRKGIE